MNLPDKNKHKSTTTKKLRADIAALAAPGVVYLEVGHDVGYTLMSMAEHFEKCIGIDNNPARHEDAFSLRESMGVENVELICGTLEDTPQGEYEVVFIDADHSYEAVKRDWELVQQVNTAPKWKCIFHDYGLLASGIKRFIQETFSREQVTFLGQKEDWNPLGGEVNDWEAVMVEVINDVG